MPGVRAVNAPLSSASVIPPPGGREAGRGPLDKTCFNVRGTVTMMDRVHPTYLASPDYRVVVPLTLPAGGSHASA